MKEYLYEIRTRRVRRSFARDSALGRTCNHVGHAARILLKLLAGEAREHFCVLHLGADNTITGYETVAIGSLTSVEVHPREVFRSAIQLGAAVVLLGHNHPSGNPAPSAADRDLTQRLCEAGDLLGIPVLDHVIVAEPGRFYSFVENGDMIR